MQVLFWGSLIFIIYTYFGYPLLIVSARTLRSKPVHRGGHELPVTVVIAARNEARRIRQRISNLFDQAYPKALLDIVVVSDGSTDDTKSVIEELQTSRVTLVELPTNQGKAAAINVGVGAACGELIVFTDARQIFAPDAVRQLVADFADASVGCVSGELFFLEDAESTVATEMGAYWKYEKLIRKAESRTGSVVGATGSIYAIRRSLFKPLPSGAILDDVLTPLAIARQGYRVLFEEQAHAFDIVSKDVSQEWTRKVRTLAGNWQMLSLEPSLLLPRRNPLWWRFLSHKIFRLLVPFFMFSVFGSSLILDGMFYKFAVIAQVFFYATAILSWLVPSVRSVRMFNLCYVFMTMNAAAMAGFWRWATGQCATSWKPAYTEVAR